MMPRALIVEDAPEMRMAAAKVLERCGFVVAECDDGAEALRRARDVPPDLVLLDLELPSLDGVEVCRQLRTFSDAYIIMVTGRDEELDKVLGLSVGADDYVTKPYSPRELAARVTAIMRRPRSGAPAGGDVRRLGAVTLDLDAHQVSVDGVAVNLTRTEFALLQALSDRPGSVLTRDALLERVWGPSWFGDEHVVDVHVSNLRRKLAVAGADRRFIQTVRGVGMRLGQTASR